MLIHSPQPWDDLRGGDYAEGKREAWRALEDARRAGKIRSVCVSNYRQHALENLLQGTSVVPEANQLLVHTSNTPSELLAYCESEQILVKAYLPIAHSANLENAEVQAMAQKYGASVPRLCIRYTLQLGPVALPKTANPGHMRSNAEVDFEITAADMDVLRGLRNVDYGEHSTFPV